MATFKLPDKDQMGRAATTAVVAGGVTKMMDPSASIAVPNVGRMPLWAVSGACGATASLISDYTHDLVLGHLDASLKFEEAGATTLALTSGGASHAAVTAALDIRLMSEQGGFYKVATVGALSVGAGHWLWNQMSDKLVM